jgi:hypothetical protein
MSIHLESNIKSILRSSLISISSVKLNNNEEDTLFINSITNALYDSILRITSIKIGKKSEKSETVPFLGYISTSSRDLSVIKDTTQNNALKEILIDKIKTNFEYLQQSINYTPNETDYKQIVENYNSMRTKMLEELMKTSTIEPQINITGLQIIFDKMFPSIQNITELDGKRGGSSMNEFEKIMKEYINENPKDETIQLFTEPSVLIELGKYYTSRMDKLIPNNVTLQKLIINSKTPKNENNTAVANSFVIDKATEDLTQNEYNTKLAATLAVAASSFSSSDTSDTDIKSVEEHKEKEIKTAAAIISAVSDVNPTNSDEIQDVDETHKDQLSKIAAIVSTTETSSSIKPSPEDDPLNINHLANKDIAEAVIAESSSQSATNNDILIDPTINDNNKNIAAAIIAASSNNLTAEEESRKIADIQNNKDIASAIIAATKEKSSETSNADSNIEDKDSEQLSDKIAAIITASSNNLTTEEDDIQNNKNIAAAIIAATKENSSDKSNIEDKDSEQLSDKIAAIITASSNNLTTESKIQTDNDAAAVIAASSAQSATNNDLLIEPIINDNNKNIAAAIIAASLNNLTAEEEEESRKMTNIQNKIDIAAAIIAATKEKSSETSNADSNIEDKDSEQLSDKIAAIITASSNNLTTESKIQTDNDEVDEIQKKNDNVAAAVIAAVTSKKPVEEVVDEEIKTQQNKDNVAAIIAAISNSKESENQTDDDDIENKSPNDIDPTVIAAIISSLPTVPILPEHQDIPVRDDNIAAIIAASVTDDDDKYISEDLYVDENMKIAAITAALNNAPDKPKTPGSSNSGSDSDSKDSDSKKKSGDSIKINSDSGDSVVLTQGIVYKTNMKDMNFYETRPISDGTFKTRSIKFDGDKLFILDNGTWQECTVENYADLYTGEEDSNPKVDLKIILNTLKSMMPVTTKLPEKSSVATK